MKTVTVVDFESGTLRMIEMVNKNNRIEITRSLTREYPAGAMDADWLRSAWTEGGFPKTKAIVLIPHDLVAYRTVIVPPLPQEQLAAAAQLELENNNGFPALSGWQCRLMYFHPDGTGMISVRLVLWSESELEKICALFLQTGISISWLGFHWRGLQNYLNFHRTDMSDTESKAILDIAATRSELTVFHDDEVLYHREFLPGRMELTGDDDIPRDDWCQEVRLSQAAYQGLGLKFGWPSVIWEFCPTAMSFHLTGILAGMDTPQLNIPIQASFHDAPNPQADAATHDTLKEFQAMIGLGLEGIGWTVSEQFQILGRAQLQQKRFQAGWRNVAGYLLAGLLCTGGLILGVQAQYEKNRKIAAWLNTHVPTLSQLRRDERETRDDLAQIRLLEIQRQRKNRELEFMLALQQELPEGTLISDLTMEDGAIKDLSGVTPAVSVLLQRIKTAPLLRKLILKGAVTMMKDGELFHLEGPVEILPVTEGTRKGDSQ